MQLNNVTPEEVSMGLFSGIKKLVKKALKLTGVSQAFGAAKGLWDNLTGKTAAENMAKTQEAQLKAQAESAKLESANEVQNVVKFDEGGSTSNDLIRRKKSSTGAFSSGIGLQV